MNFTKCLVAALIFLFCPQSKAQDPAITAALKRVDAARIEAHIKKLSSFGTRHALSTGKDQGIVAAGEWIKGHFEKCAATSKGRMTVRYDSFDPRKYARGDRLALSKLEVKEIRNVLAELKGSEPDRVIVVSGHYDSRASKRNDTTTDAPGANDDGSGTAAVMELARVLATVETKATIIFATLTAEEQGLWGARNLAEGLDKNNVNVEAMITNDIIGGAKDKDGKSEEFVVRVFSQGRPQVRKNSNKRIRRLARNPSESDSPSRQWARYLSSAAKTYIPKMKTRLIFRLDRFLRGGDHKPFTELGYAALRMTEPKENYTRQHQDPRTENGIRYGDFPENVDFKYVSRVARVNAAAILSLARAPGPTSAAYISSRLTNDTHLNWKAVPGATKYRVLMRRTHRPTWHKHYDVGNVTTHVLVESKDDWLFAIQALDDAGHKSLPTFAIPGR
ncbi:MAG: hypothetical protein ACI97A_003099 [Planctomycetota bacterium]|jgi:hypothetical protein